MIIKLTPFVLVQETIDKFGYDPSLFNKKTDYTKYIVRTCFVCNHIYDQQIISSIRSFKNNQKCKYCSNKSIALSTCKKNAIDLKARYASGDLISSRIGKEHTQEVKDKLSKFHSRPLEEKLGKEKSDEIKKKLKENYSDERKEKQSKLRKNKKYEEIYGEEKANEIKKNLKENYSDERKENISKFRKNKTLEQLYGIEKANELNFNQRKSFVEKFGEEKANEMKMKISLKVSGENNPAYGKIYSIKWHFKRELYKGFYFRSSYETKVAKYLDENNIEWDYETIAFKLNNGTTYRPDFYLIKEDKWIEVKGYWYENKKEKFNLFKQLYPNINIEVWNKEKLQSLGILN